MIIHHLVKLQRKSEASCETCDNAPAAEMELLHRDHKFFLATEIWDQLRQVIATKMQEGASFDISL